MLMWEISVYYVNYRLINMVSVLLSSVLGYTTLIDFGLVLLPLTHIYENDFVD